MIDEERNLWCCVKSRKWARRTLKEFGDFRAWLSEWRALVSLGEPRGLKASKISLCYCASFL